MTAATRTPASKEVARRQDVVSTAQHGAAPAEQARQETLLCTGEGERLGLYAIIAETGPVTALGLSRDALIPMSLALRWLAAQTHSGHVVRDVVTGRYRTWCTLPDPQ